MTLLYTVPKLKACQSCAAAKAKCEPYFGYTQCKRCSKLGLECIVKEAAPRKRRKHNPNDEERYSGRNSSTEGLLTIGSTCAFSQLELQRGIEYYRCSLAQYFPFVVLPNTLTANHNLGEEKPFLSLILAMLGSTEDRMRQRALAVKSREYLADHVLVKGDRSLELLQGVLLTCYWYHFQSGLLNQRGVLMHLAMAMVVDLELNKSPFTRSRVKKASELTNGFDMGTDGITDHTLDERRAFLGCLWLSSVKSKCVLNMDAMRFSDYAEECCVHLENSKLPSDQLITRMLRLQQIVEQFESARISFSREHRTNGLASDSKYNFESQSSQVNFLTIVNHFAQKLDECWSHIPQGGRTLFLQVQYHFAEICLYEACLEDTLFGTSQDRLEVIRKCVSAIKALLDTFVPASLRLELVMSMPSHLFAESSHAIFVAVQLLCSVQCEGWSGGSVERTINLVPIFDASSKFFDEMLDTNLQNRIPDFFHRLAPIGKGIKKWYGAKARASEEAGSMNAEAVATDKQDDELDLDFLGQFLDLDDNLWLQNMLSCNDPTAPLPTYT